MLFRSSSDQAFKRAPKLASDMGILAEASFGARLKAWSLELETVRYSVGTELEKNDAYVAELRSRRPCASTSALC